MTKELSQQGATFVQKLDIFISSPSDVNPEREIILRVIEKLNRNPFIRKRYYLNPLAYEREVPPDGGQPAQIIVDRYMGEAKDSYLVICLLWSRMGTPFKHPITEQEFQSGTEYEYVSAYNQKIVMGKPHLLLYRKIAENPNADPDQNKKVADFFKRFEGADAELKGLYKPYATPKEFEEMLYEHILVILSEHPPQESYTPIAIPQIVEEERRLYAAMPRQITVKQPTEIWVQICLPNSRGFRDRLPHTTEEGDIIDQNDIKGGNLAVAFPIDNVTQQVKPIAVTIEVLAHDFDISLPLQAITISLKTDSALVVFQVTLCATMGETTSLKRLE